MNWTEGERRIKESRRREEAEAKKKKSRKIYGNKWMKSSEDVTIKGWQLTIYITVASSRFIRYCPNTFCLWMESGKMAFNALVLLLFLASFHLPKPSNQIQFTRWIQWSSQQFIRLFDWYIIYFMWYVILILNLCDYGDNGERLIWH